MKPKAVIAGAAVVLLGVVVHFVRRSPAAGPEEQIRNALQSAADAAEKQDLGGVMQVVSKRFTGPDGDRQALNAFLFFQLRQGAWRKVFLVNTRVKLEPGADPRRADVTFDAVLSSGPNVTTLADVLPDQAGVHSFSVVMEREDDAWLVTSAAHQARGLGDVLRLP